MLEMYRRDQFREDARARAVRRARRRSRSGSASSTRSSPPPRPAGPRSRRRCSCGAPLLRRRPTSARTAAGPAGERGGRLRAAAGTAPGRRAVLRGVRSSGRGSTPTGPTTARAERRRPGRAEAEPRSTPGSAERVTVTPEERQAELDAPEPPRARAAAPRRRRPGVLPRVRPAAPPPHGVVARLGDALAAQARLVSGRLDLARARRSSSSPRSARASRSSRRADGSSDAARTLVATTSGLAAVDHDRRPPRSRPRPARRRRRPTPTAPGRRPPPPEPRGARSSGRPAGRLHARPRVDPASGRPRAGDREGARRRSPPGCRTSACSTPSQFSGLHPGYFVVFSGVYAARREAQRRARRGARRRLLGRLRAPGHALSGRGVALGRNGQATASVPRRSRWHERQRRGGLCNRPRSRVGSLRAGRPGQVNPRVNKAFAAHLTGTRQDSDWTSASAQLRNCMYQYSRAIYRSIKDLIDPYVDPRDAARVPPRGARARASRRWSGSPTDPHYFAKPDRALFQDIRRYFPITRQAQVAWAVQRGRRRRGRVHRGADRGRRARRRRRPLPRDDAQGQAVPAHAAARARLLPVAPASRARSKVAA